jgi:molecular chaperone DnaJ
LENFYDILGVTETASQDDIKRAYRKKAVESHPDKGGDEEIFKKISEAYDTLGDEQKRKDYDMQKNNPFGNFGSDPFGSFNDFFSNITNQRVRKAPDKIIDIQIGTIDSFLGKNIDIRFQRKNMCNSCNGQGGERVTCNTCNGSGRITQRVGNSFFSNIFQVTCNSCNGKGFNLKNVCYSCAGEGKNNELQTINLNIPHGISDGQMIKASGYGDWHDGMFGDAILKVQVVEQDGFEKLNNDLIYNYQMSLDDFNRDTLDIPHPSGNLNIKLPETIDTQKPLRIKGKGYKNEGVGDFYVKMYVKHKRS